MPLRASASLCFGAAAAAALAATGATLAWGPKAVAAPAPAPAALAHHEDGSHADRDLIETAMNGERFTTLVTAAEAAGLNDTLKGEGPFTLFAPTDEAFEGLPPAALEELLEPENQDRLRALLLHHVVEGEALAEDVKGMSELTTMQGAKLQVTREDGRIMLNGATVTEADLMASNGVIHVIDTVLMPQMGTPAAGEELPAEVDEDSPEDD